MNIPTRPDTLWFKSLIIAAAMIWIPASACAFELKLDIKLCSLPQPSIDAQSCADRFPGVPICEEVCISRNRLALTESEDDDIDQCDPACKHACNEWNLQCKSPTHK